MRHALSVANLVTGAGFKVDCGGSGPQAGRQQAVVGTKWAVPRQAEHIGLNGKSNDPYSKHARRGSAAAVAHD